MKKTVVTGGAGFIGTTLVDALIKDGYEVHVVDNFSTGSRKNIHQAARYHELDVTDGYKKMVSIFNGAAVVFHLASTISVPFSLKFPEKTSSNIQGTINVLRAAKEAGVARVLFVSSAAVYGDQRVPISEKAECKPLSPYGLEKRVGEEYCQLFSRIYNISTVTTRLFNIYGPGQTDKDGALIPTLLEKVKKGRAISLYGSGDQKRDFVYIEDVVDAFLKLAFSKENFMGDVFNVGSGEGVSVLSVMKLITNNIEKVPARLEITDSIANIEKIRKVVGWQPTVKIKEGLDKIKRHGL